MNKGHEGKGRVQTGETNEHEDRGGETECGCAKRGHALPARFCGDNGDGASDMNRIDDRMSTPKSKSGSGSGSGGGKRNKRQGRQNKTRTWYIREHCVQAGVPVRNVERGGSRRANVHAGETPIKSESRRPVAMSAMVTVEVRNNGKPVSSVRGEMHAKVER